MSTYRDTTVELVRSRGMVRGALLGVGTSALFDALLASAPDLFLFGVDHFVRPDRRTRAVNAAHRHLGRCTLLIMKTGEAAPLLPNESLEFVFIDAGHKYGCVRADIRSWWPKVRPGGLIGGHDFDDQHLGVQRAVTERFGPMIKRLDNSVWYVDKYDG